MDTSIFPVIGGFAAAAVSLKSRYITEDATMSHLPIKNSTTGSIPEKIPKPVIKWVGGKTQILSRVIGEFPAQMADYHEPFLGGGSVLLAVLAYRASGRLQIDGVIRASDANAPLVSVYKNIQSHHEKLYSEIQLLLAEFSECGEAPVNRTPLMLEDAKGSRESYYYWTRRRYNELSEDAKLSAAGSAMFMFLNKTCFRGIFRVGPSGFNVPYGNNKNPEVANVEHLAEISELIQGVEFTHADFAESLATVERGDFVYLDPPYAPENATSFVGYTKGGFGPKQHSELFGMIHKMAAKGARALMSNADVSLVRSTFPESEYSIESIECKRSINSKNPGAKTQEVLVRNYA
jgi:DNA adenine methylase